MYGRCSRAGYDGAYTVLNHGHFVTNYRYLPLKKISDQDKILSLLRFVLGYCKSKKMTVYIFDIPRKVFS